MQQALINSTKDIFDSPEKWETFLDLDLLKDKITAQWYSKLGDELHLKIKLNPEWSYNKSGMQWYLEKYGRKSLSIWLEKAKFSLWADGYYYDLDKIRELLKDSRFMPIYYGMPFKESIMQGNYIIEELGRYTFGSHCDNCYTDDQLAWYAGNRTEEFAMQVKQRVDHFMKKEITDLLIELNEKSRKNI